MQRKNNALADARRREALAGYLLCAPSFLGFLVFVLIPVIYAGVLSFSKINLFTNETAFVGLQNYRALAKTLRFSSVLGNTLWYMVFATAGNTIFGLLLALALNDRLTRRTSVFFRAVYFFPSLVGLVFVAIIWQYLFQADMGIINYYLGKLGINKIAWLSNPSWARGSVVILDVWKNAGMSMLLILAGLQNVNPAYHEAARIDGANGWQIFWCVTLPSLSPTLFFVVVMHMTGALRIFESVTVLTGGGPGDASRSLVMLIAEKGFASYDYGGASAISMILLAIIAVFTLAQFIGSRWWVHYE
jgi:multiple sugar transport system permease protein